MRTLKHIVDVRFIIMRLQLKEETFFLRNSYRAKINPAKKTNESEFVAKYNVMNITLTVLTVQTKLQQFLKTGTFLYF